MPKVGNISVFLPCFYRPMPVSMMRDVSGALAFGASDLKLETKYGFLVDPYFRSCAVVLVAHL